MLNNALDLLFCCGHGLVIWVCSIKIPFRVHDFYYNILFAEALMIDIEIMATELTVCM
jgi:hypothetical protein